MKQKITIAAVVLMAAFVMAAMPTQAAGRDGMVVRQMSVAWANAWPRLEAAIGKNSMGIVSRASASAGARSRGVIIPGNMVVGVYRNDFAVRMLAASVDAGIEAPLRFYLTEDASGQVKLGYRRPSATFAPYPGDDLKNLAAELDAIFADIAHDATR